MTYIYKNELLKSDKMTSNVVLKCDEKTQKIDLKSTGQIYWSSGCISLTDKAYMYMVM